MFFSNITEKMNGLSWNLQFMLVITHETIWNMWGMLRLTPWKQKIFLMDIFHDNPRQPFESRCVFLSYTLPCFVRQIVTQILWMVSCKITYAALSYTLLKSVRKNVERIKRSSLAKLVRWCYSRKKPLVISPTILQITSVRKVNLNTIKFPAQ